MTVETGLSLSFLDKISRFYKPLIYCASIIVIIGAFMLYGSAGANLQPWASAHITRYIMGIFLCVIISFTPIDYIFKPIYLIYFIVIGLLLATMLFGETHKGAQRWISLGFIRLQPSELAKITTILALARFLHEAYTYRILPIFIVVICLFLMMVPAIFILKQPDLGTCLLLIFSSIVVIFMAGLDWRLFFFSGIGILLSMPIIWLSMKSYQKQRVLTFLDPSSDPLGAGYHITQAKIAMGSGGYTGRGFMKGPQSLLEFLPEKHTDFAFTAYAEQFGFVGSITLLLLFFAMIFMMLVMAYKCHHIFGKLLITGLTANFFFYIFVNIAMISGLTPVVGVPLPFMSYGGTVMISVFISLGLIQNSFIHKKIKSRGIKIH